MILSRTQSDPGMARNDKYVWFVLNNKDVLFDALLQSQQLRMTDREMSIAADDEQDEQVLFRSPPG